MSLGLLSWLLTIPKPVLLVAGTARLVLLQQAVFGGPNWTRLNVLKNSVRNCKPSLFSGPKFVVLNKAKSQLLIPAPRIVGSTRDSSPKSQADAAREPPGGAKQFTLNQANPAEVGWTFVLLLHPGTTFGRRAKFCVKPALDRGVDAPYEIGRGKPF